jgi:hypothetical protein
MSVYFIWKTYTRIAQNLSILFSIFWVSNLLSISVPDEGCSINGAVVVVW